MKVLSLVTKMLCWRWRVSTLRVTELGDVEVTGHLQEGISEGVGVGGLTVG